MPQVLHLHEHIWKERLRKTEEGTHIARVVQKAITDERKSKNNGYKHEDK